MSDWKITVKSGNEESTLEVTEEEYRNYYRPRWQQKKREQRNREAMEQNGYTEESYEAWRDPIPGAERILLADIAVNQQPDIHRQSYLLQFAGVFIGPPDNRLVFPVTVHNVIHDAVPADVHQLVQCRILFHPIPLLWCRILPLNRGIGKRKIKKPDSFFGFWKSL